MLIFAFSLWNSKFLRLKESYRVKISRDIIHRKFKEGLLIKTLNVALYLQLICRNEWQSTCVTCLMLRSLKTLYFCFNPLFCSLRTMFCHKWNKRRTIFPKLSSVALAMASLKSDIICVKMKWILNFWINYYVIWKTFQYTVWPLLLRRANFLDTFVYLNHWSHNYK